MIGHLYRQGELNELVTAGRTLLMVAVSNAASFAFGFVGFGLLLTDL
jgi:hypothetical protein